MQDLRQDSSTLLPKENHLEAAKLLTAHGADVNLKRGPDALFAAAFEGHGQIAELLLKNGARSMLTTVTTRLIFRNQCWFRRNSHNLSRMARMSTEELAR